jgi:hypothetical protein
VLVVFKCVDCLRVAIFEGMDSIDRAREFAALHRCSGKRAPSGDVTP